uniref:Zinc finger protein 581 n=1 Tax=Loxodonta africana TaxID=9785 RepID=G3UEA9_LOXAF
MLVLPLPCPQPQALLSLEAMEAPPPRIGRSPEPGPSSSTGSPQTSPPQRPNHYLLIDTQGVPYTVLVDEESQRGSGAEGAAAQKKCYSCPVCSKRASHLTRHHSIHGCPLCPRRFREAGELAQHSRVHSGERPFQCPHCPRRFMEQNTLQKHTRWKHP